MAAAAFVLVHNASCGDGSTSASSGAAHRRSRRIVGGRPAAPGRWPWMAALLNTYAGIFCGGVLVSDQHVLTAANCVNA